MPLRRGGKTEFFEEGGEVHPIRDSPGYDPEVEKVSAEQKEHARREAHHRGLQRGQKRERSEIDRPPWARGMTDLQLTTSAREHGQRATEELWWEKAGLYGREGEMRYLKEGSHVGEQRGRAARRGFKAGKRARALGLAPTTRSAPKQTRYEAGRAAERSATGADDLPF